MIDSISNLAAIGHAASSSSASSASGARDSAPGNGDFAKLLAQSAKPAASETTPDETDVTAPESAAIDKTALVPATPQAQFDTTLPADAASGDEAANVDALQALDAQFATLLPFIQLAPMQVALPRGDQYRAALAPPISSAVTGADASLLTSQTQRGAENALAQVPASANMQSGEPDAAAVASTFAALMGATSGIHPSEDVATANPRRVTPSADLSGSDEKSTTAGAVPITDLPVASQLSPALSFLQTAASTVSANHAGTVLVATHIDTPGWSKDFGQHVIRLAVDGQPGAEIHLNPPELGPIRISIEFKGQDATINFAATHAHTRVALECALPALRDMFAANDLSLTGANVSSDSFSQNPSAPHDERQAGHPQRHAHSLRVSDDAAANMAAVRIPVDGARVDLFA